MPIASIIVPAYNACATLRETVESLLSQTFPDFEVIIVNDGSTDDTRTLAESFTADARVRVVNQSNRGLAGARNSGIAAARGRYIGFCDADDLWRPEKLAAHVHHLETNPEIGISYSGSELIDTCSSSVGLRQCPKLRNITTAHLFCRNPIGNGSAPVIRKAALDDIAWTPRFEVERPWYFDETFRQSEDIECWLRMMLKTDWQMAGIPGALTLYRVNTSGLSAATDRQLASWERMVDKLRPLHPDFFTAHENAARAYQMRYLARRAVSSLNGESASHYALQTLACSTRPLFHEPMKTITTLAAAAVLKLVGPAPLKTASRLIAQRRPV